MNKHSECIASNTKSPIGNVLQAIQSPLLAMYFKQYKVPNWQCISSNTKSPTGNVLQAIQGPLLAMQCKQYKVTYRLLAMYCKQHKSPISNVMQAIQSPLLTIIHVIHSKVGQEKEARI
jgi:hypothetical protein